MSFLWFLLVGLIAGWLAGLVVKGRGFGIIGDIVVGVIGAFIGGFLFGGMIGNGTIGAILSAFFGALILLVVIKVLNTSGAVCFKGIVVLINLLFSNILKLVLRHFALHFHWILL